MRDKNMDRRPNNNRNGYSHRPQRQHDRGDRAPVVEKEMTGGSDSQSRVVLMTLAELEARSVDDLQEMAKELDISGFSRLKKQDLAFRILQAQTEQQGNIFKKGILDI